MLAFDFAAAQARLPHLSDAALRYSAADAIGAAECAAQIERAGGRALKGEGYYRDEALTYLDELRRRQEAR